MGLTRVRRIILEDTWRRAYNAAVSAHGCAAAGYSKEPLGTFKSEYATRISEEILKDYPGLSSTITHCDGHGLVTIGVSQLKAPQLFRNATKATIEHYIGMAKWWSAQRYPSLLELKAYARGYLKGLESKAESTKQAASSAAFPLQ